MEDRAMSQRTKATEASRLTVVPAETETESRGPATSEVKAPAKGTLTANRKRILLGAAAAVLLAAGWFSYDYMTTGRFLISTDDAYVRAYNTTLGAKVSGYVSAFLVDDNTKVHSGDVIARIDDGDYRLAVNSARDKAATQEATIARFDPQIA